MNEILGLLFIVAVIGGLWLYIDSRIRSIKDDESIYMSTDPDTCRDIHAHLWRRGTCPLGCQANTQDDGAVKAGTTTVG